MCDGGNCFYGTINFNGSGKFAIYIIQIQCGKLVAFNYWNDGIFVFLL